MTSGVPSACPGPGLLTLYRCEAGGLTLQACWGPWAEMRGKEGQQGFRGSGGDPSNNRAALHPRRSPRVALGLPTPGKRKSVRSPPAR